MRDSVLKFTMVLALASGCFIAMACSGDVSDPDGGAGAGGGTVMDGGDAATGTVGCLMDVPLSCPTPRVTYDMVQPIIQKRCAGICHNGTTPDPANMNAPIWPLTELKHLSDWRATIRSTMADCTMPPVDAGVPVTIEDRKAIVEFIRCEFPNP